MPWKVYKDGEKNWCVYKHDADGKKVGDAMGCHASEEDANAQMKALYANVKEFGGSLDDQISAVRLAFDRQFNIYPTPPGVPTIWVADVFPDYVVISGDEQQHFKVGYTKTDGKITFDARDQWQRVQLSYTPIAEQAHDAPTAVKELIEAEVVSEFKGKFPEIPPAPGVNMAELLAGDENPMFLTLPLSVEGMTSRNGLTHDAALGADIVRQVNTDKPGGLMGHLRDEERSTAHPVSDIHWIGAVQVPGAGGKLVTWGKGYIPRTRPEVREQYRIEKAKGGRATTSLYGKAFKELAQGTTTWRAREFDLEQIDLAPFKRAAAPGSGEFYITSEMATEPITMTTTPLASTEIEVTEVQEDKPMDKKQLIAELTAGELTPELKAAVIAEYEATQQNAKIVAELTAARDQAKVRITELETTVTAQQTQISEYEAIKFGGLVDAKIAELTAWECSTDPARAKRDSLRAAIKVAVIAEMGTDRTEAKLTEAAQKVWDSTYKVLAESVRDTLSGPAALVRGNRSNDIQVDTSPEALKRAAAAMGL